MLKIIQATDPIHVETLVAMIVGQPGVGKTSTAFTASKPLLLDFDSGAHRAHNRKDAVRIADWAEVALLSADEFAAYDTIVIDTAGRALDMITAHLVSKNPKLAKASGALSLQGYGELKATFVSWIKQLRLLGKDVVMLAHDAEEKDGDQVSVRPDIQGGSRNEVIKAADLIGFLYMDGKNRVLDFSPSEKWIGKNCADFAPLVVPDFAKDPHFLAKVLAQAKAHLNKLSAEAQGAQAILAHWQDHMALVQTVEDANSTLALIGKSALGRQARTIKGLLATRTRDLGIVWNAGTSTFELAPPAVAEVTV